MKKKQELNEKEQELENNKTKIIDINILNILNKLSKEELDDL